MGISVFDHAWRDFMSLIYPRYCFACEGYLVSGEQEICSRCLFDLPKTDFHQNIKNEFYRKLEGRLPLKFVLAHPAVSTVIPGMRTVAQAEANCAVSDLPAMPGTLVEKLHRHNWRRGVWYGGK